MILIIAPKHPTHYKKINTHHREMALEMLATVKLILTVMAEWTQRMSRVS
jgi:hypothetical protein